MAKKTPVKFTKGSGDGHIRMSDLVSGKAAQYKVAKWGWLKKYVKNYKAIGNKPTLVIKVAVWGPDGKAAHQALGQEFTPDSLSAAKNYAKKLVQDGLAVMTDIRGWYSQSFGRYAGGGIAADFGRFERTEMREAKNLSPKVEKEIAKIEAAIKSGKTSEKEGRKQIGDLMSAVSKVGEAIIDAHLAGETVEEIIEKVSGHDPRWGNAYPYAPTVTQNAPAYYDSDCYNYPLGNVSKPPRTSHETHVADGHEAEADEYMATGRKR